MTSGHGQLGTGASGPAELLSDHSVRCVHLLPETTDHGAENQAFYLLQHLARTEWLQLELAYFSEGKAHQRFEALNLPLYELPRRRRLMLDYGRRARQFRQALGATPPALIHTWLPEANVVGLHAARAWPDTRVIISERAGLGRSPKWKLAFEHRFVGRADHAIANSHDGRHVLRQLGVDDARISVIPNGIPEERLAINRDRGAIREALGIDPDAPLVVSVGRPDPQKDFPLLAAAFALVLKWIPSACLVIVGASAEELRQLGVETLGQSLAVGWQTDVVDYINAADVLAVSSWTEGCSNAACEALMLGVPVATTDVGEHAAIAREAGGQVVPARDAGGLAEALVSLLSQPPDPSLVRASAQKLLSIDRFAAETLALYERLLRV